MHGASERLIAFRNLVFVFALLSRPAAGPVLGSVPCPNNCSGWGDCVNGVCVCYEARVGIDCSQTFADLEPALFWTLVYVTAALNALLTILCIIILCKLWPFTFDVRIFSYFCIGLSALIITFYTFLDPLSARNIFSPFLRFFLPMISEIILLLALSALLLFWIEVILSIPADAAILRRTWPYLIVLFVVMTGIALASSLTDLLELFYISQLAYLLLFAIAFVVTGLLLRKKLREMETGAHTARITRLSVGAAALSIVLWGNYLAFYVLLVINELTPTAFLVISFLIRMFAWVLSVYLAWVLSPGVFSGPESTHSSHPVSTGALSRH